MRPSTLRRGRSAFTHGEMSRFRSKRQLFAPPMPAPRGGLQLHSSDGATEAARARANELIEEELARGAAELIAVRSQSADSLRAAVRQVSRHQVLALSNRASATQVSAQSRTTPQVSFHDDLQTVAPRPPRSIPAPQDLIATEVLAIPRKPTLASIRVQVELATEAKAPVKATGSDPSSEASGAVSVDTLHLSVRSRPPSPLLPRSAAETTEQVTASPVQAAQLGSQRAGPPAAETTGRRGLFAVAAVKLFGGRVSIMPASRSRHSSRNTSRNSTASHNSTASRNTASALSSSCGSGVDEPSVGAPPTIGSTRRLSKSSGDRTLPVRHPADGLAGPASTRHDATRHKLLEHYERRQQAAAWQASSEAPRSSPAQKAARAPDEAEQEDGRRDTMQRVVDKLQTRRELEAAVHVQRAARRLICRAAFQRGRAAFTATPSPPVSSAQQIRDYGTMRVEMARVHDASCPPTLTVAVPAEVVVEFRQSCKRSANTICADGSPPSALNTDVGAGVETSGTMLGSGQAINRRASAPIVMLSPQKRPIAAGAGVLAEGLDAQEGGADAARVNTSENTNADEVSAATESRLALPLTLRSFRGGSSVPAAAERRLRWRRSKQACARVAAPACVRLCSRATSAE